VLVSGEDGVDTRYLLGDQGRGVLDGQAGI